MELSPTSLRTFVSVVDQGSFATAADELGYTASAVSQQMAALERHLGVQLFERRARSIHPTQAAWYLHDRAAEFLDLHAQLTSDLDRLAAGQAGRLRIGSFASAGAGLLAPALSSVLRKHPQLELTVHEGEPHELVPEMTQGQLDIALVFRYDLVPETTPRELLATPLHTDRLWVIAARKHRFTTKKEISFDELAAETWIGTQHDTAASRCLHAQAAIAGFTPHVSFTSNNFQAINGLVQSALGVALVPDLARRRMRGVANLPLRDLPARHIYALTRRADRNRLVENFRNELLDAGRALKS
ncbi:MAG: LysR family transcriptional regulator [Propionibacteriaceae bacterium]